jgi:phosphatidylglycerophosphate synthase
MENIKNRRPLATRQKKWAQRFTVFLAATSLTPNTISVLGIFFSLFGALVFCAVGFHILQPVFLVAAALFVQLRLLCNMMDGLLAVEAKKGEPTGVLFNEAPDRLEDVLFFLGAGIAASACAWGICLGFFCALLALGTAYVRVLGGSLGLEQDFCGPMAKQHRMFSLTLASVLSAIEFSCFKTNYILPLFLCLIAVGSLITIVLRLQRISNLLKAKS